MLIDQLLQADPRRETPIGVDPSLEQRSARHRRQAERVQSLRGMPSDLLADELHRRGWSVIEG